MSNLHTLDVRDIRNQLPTRNWRIGWSDTRTFCTVHYNGQVVPAHRQRGAGVMQQLRIGANWQMRPGWGGARNGADGYQYHLVVDADGIIYQTRDLNAVLWHCGHSVGNERSIAVHLPLGGYQDATNRQWERTALLLATLCEEYDIPTNNVRGHLEWSATSCPGPNLMPRVRQWRANPTTLSKYESYLVIEPTAIRQSPSHEGVLVTRLQRNTPLEVAPHSNGYGHLADHQGFVWMEHLRKVNKRIASGGTITTDAEIMHVPRTTPEQVVRAIMSRPTGEYNRDDVRNHIVPAYFLYGGITGVDPLISIAQMLHETGNLSSWWAARPRRNPAGIGVTGTPGAGVWFATWSRHAVPAQVGRLAAYAGGSGHVVDYALRVRPLPDHLHGVAPTLKGLSGTWATDSRYAEKVATWANHILKF